MADPTMREMLEAAAMVAKVGPLRWETNGFGVEQCLYRADDYPWGILWRPHLDDGDSARLRSARMMDVHWTDDAVTVTCGRIWHAEKLADHSNDRNAALRLATLRCAVEYARRIG